MFITELSKANLRIKDSRNVDRWLGLDRGFLASQDRQIDDRLIIASLIRRSQAQCGAGYPIHFLKNLDMIFQFFPVTRHLRFEDIQAVVDLIGDAVQISGLLVDTVLYDGFCSDLCDLLCYLVPFCNPFVPTRTGVKGIQADPILRSNEASSLPSKELSLNDFPIDRQCFTHKTSLCPIVHKVKASMIPRFEDALTHNQRSNNQ